MKTINCWDDLSRYGIVLLTGEACGLSYRLLCDVTAAGKRVIEKALGIAQLGLHESWTMAMRTIRMSVRLCWPRRS